MYIFLPKLQKSLLKKKNYIYYYFIVFIYNLYIIKFVNALINYL